MSAGEHISLGSPSWIQPAATGSGPFHREEIPGVQRVKAPAQCPSSPICCWRPSCQQTGGFHCELLEVFRCSVVPTFGDSSYLKPTECHSCSHPWRKKKKLAPKADVRVCCSGRATSTSVCLSQCCWSDRTLIFGDRSWLIHLNYSIF